MTSAEQLLDLIEKHAPGLRKAGVLSVSIEGLSAQLAPAPIEVPAGNAEPAGEPGADPLQDPALYPGGIVPGYTLAPEDEQ